MPVFENKATEDTACVSTAPVFLDARTTATSCATAKRGGAVRRAGSGKLRGSSKGRRSPRGTLSGSAGTKTSAADDQALPKWWTVFEPRAPEVAEDPASQSGGKVRPKDLDLSRYCHWGPSSPSGSIFWAAWLAALLGGGVASPNTHEGMMLFFAFSLPVVASCVLIPENGHSVLPYWIHLFVGMLSFKSMATGGMWLHMPLFYIFVAVPVVDWVVGVDLANHSVPVQQALHRQSRFKYLTYSVVPVQLAIIAYGCHVANTRALDWGEYFGLCWCMGIYTGAIGINFGHELCHKSAWIERAFGRFLLSSVSYGHFYVEHTLGHHKMVCTDEDPATARYGESFYAFLPRVIIGEYQSAVRIEADRLRRKKLPFWKNEIPMYFAFSVALAAGYVWAFGPNSLGAFVGQSAVAILLFESVNYLEHYGLERRRDPATGKHETVKPRHSWDSPAQITNMILIKLQRHADHHAHAGKRFQTLQLFDESPQLPGGYATMIALSFFPPLWRWVMHPRLMKFRATQEGQVWRHGPTPGAVGGAPKSAK